MIASVPSWQGNARKGKGSGRVIQINPSAFRKNRSTGGPHLDTHPRSATHPLFNHHVLAARSISPTLGPWATPRLTMSRPSSGNTGVGSGLVTGSATKPIPGRHRRHPTMSYQPVEQPGESASNCRSATSSARFGTAKQYGPQRYPDDCVRPPTTLGARQTSEHHR